MNAVFQDESLGSERGVAASGVALRQAREARGFSLAEVAHTLKLTPRQIEAIENENLSQLPGIAFARGFIRNYARFLGLDPSPLLERLDLPAQIQDVRLAPESNAEGAVPSEPAGYRSQSMMPAVLAVVLIVGVGFAAWYFDFGKLIGTRPLNRTEPATSASDSLFPPQSDETAVVTAQAEAQASAPVVASESEPPAALASQTPVEHVAQSTPVAVASAVVANGGTGLHFNFEQDAWVEVRDASGKIVFSQLSKAGSSQDVLGQAPFFLVVGNAAHVKLEFNGRPVDLSPHTKVSVARLTLK